VIVAGHFLAGCAGSLPSENALNTMSGELVLCRDGEVRPAHTSVAVARSKA
jgi:hypothetical protein